jgi:8-amino-3,8-dideoxy-alpha-D-manno-octulosonate transaminase
MPGFELIGNEELDEIKNIFEKSNGVLFAHGFDERRNYIYRVREFESAIANKLSVKYCLATTSGTMAQYIAMRALGIKPGDEVITQAFTFVATVETIVELGADPVIVDIDDSFNMDPIELEKAISDKTKLIVPVHMLGNQCDMKAIMRIASKYNIPVLEDGCEAMGAKYNDQYLGTIGDIGIFSLDFAKTITTGEGGLIITNDSNIEKYCREFHDHGHENNKSFPRGNDTRTIRGLNLRLSELQAAVGLAQIKKLDYIVKSNRENKSLLKSLIEDNKNIHFRRILDQENELADTLIFTMDTVDMVNKFVEEYNEQGYYTKNLPDAVQWHFSGTWNHMFNDVPRYRNSWNVEWKKSANLIERSISIPIFVKSTSEEIHKHANVINRIFDQL